MTGLHPPIAQCSELSLLSATRAKCVVLGLLLPMHVLLVGWIAVRMSPTSDEIAHLAAGVRFWTSGRADLYEVNPPLVKVVAAAPVMLTRPKVNWSHRTDEPGSREEWQVGLEFMLANWAEFRWQMLLARWACLPFSVFGLLICWRWSTEVFGPWAGVLSAACWAFSPNILGNAALITPDVPCAALCVTCLYFLRAWLNTGGWRQALLCGMFLGLANLAKFTALLLVPLILCAGLLAQSRWCPSEWRTAARPRQTFQFALLFIVGLDVLWTGYLYRGLLHPLGNFKFVSQSLSGGSPGEIGNRFHGGWLNNVPVPVPQRYLAGLDLQKRDLEATWQPLASYLRGEQRIGGWWYYYLYGMVVKAPLGGWLLAAIAAVTALEAARSAMGKSQRASAAHSLEAAPPDSAVQPLLRQELLLLLIPAGVIFLAVSSHTGFSRYFRYALPSFPFIFIGFGICWSRVAPPARFWRGWLAAGALACVILESMMVTPNQLAFFNVAAGDVFNGHQHMLDSNLDWGQDLYALRDWQLAHPESQQLRLAYSGVADPAIFNIRFEPLRRTASDESPLTPGWYAISANHLHGYDTPLGPWQKFLRRSPDARVGASLFLYHIPSE